VREEEGDPSLYDGSEYLYQQGLAFDRKRGGTSAPPSKEELRKFVESSLQIEEELHSTMRTKETTGEEEEPTNG